jgi:5-methylcytosine-specific restriction endonuclease McrA
MLEGRTPKWLCVEHKSQIRLAYVFAHAWSNLTGVKHHVDHIVPLRGKTVSGLHVPWNLRIVSAAKNLEKGNRLDPSITLL